MSKKGKDFSGLNMMINNISNKNKNVHQIEKTNEIEINKDEVLASYQFDFEVDDDTIDYLKEQTFKLHKASNNFYTELGKIFAETQEKLSKSGYGCFVEWYKSIGFKNDTVYRYISRYKLISSFAQSERQIVEKIESLPLGISYEIAKEDCPELVREKVINGEIKTVKELKEAIKEVKREEEQEAEEVIQEAEIVEKVSLDKFNLEKQTILNALDAALEKIKNGSNTPENMEILFKVQGLLEKIK